MVCSYLQEAMDLIGGEAISDCPKKINMKSKEDWFKKRKRLFEEVKVSFGTIDEECEREKSLSSVPRRNQARKNKNRVKTTMYCIGDVYQWPLTHPRSLYFS